MERADEVEEHDGSDSSGSYRSEGEDSDVAPAEPPALDRTPVHPIPSMQGAFEESILESVEDTKSKQQEKLNARARRQTLLESDNINKSYNAKWRERPGVKYHPLLKLMAQISFGVHLLHHQLAKSNDEVIKILKAHVDEIDSFLERTGEDFDLALADIKERIDHLKLPLEHVNIFDIMLDDKQFRTSIIDGNEKIERIVDLTARDMNDSLVDISKGLEATRELSEYLERIEGEWTERSEDMLGIYTAMCGNAEGWTKCFRSLKKKGNKLGVALVQLGSIVNEMSKRAGVASRRSLLQSRSGEIESRPGSKALNRAPTSRFSHSHSASIDKPLPKDPENIRQAVARDVSRKGSIPLSERWEHPRTQPKPPSVQSSPAVSDYRPPAIHQSKSSEAEPSPRTVVHGDRLEPPRPNTSKDQTTTSKSDRKSSIEALGRKLSLRGIRGNRERPSHSPSIPPDSAYSSGSSNASGRSQSPGGHKQAATSQPHLPPPSPRLGLFPPSSPFAAASTKGSVRSAPYNPPASWSTPSATPTPSRRGSSSSSFLKRRPSLSGFKRMFQRKPSGSTLGRVDES